MDLRLLRYFLVLAEELHFTRAAARLHIAQPALSHEIRQLERRLGVTLFERSRRSVRLSDTGTVLLPEARAIVARVDSAARLVARASQGEVGNLRVGFTPSSGGHLLPVAIESFRRRFPDVDIQVRELKTGGQIQALLAEDLDVGLIHDNGAAAGLETVRLRKDVLILALPAGHPQARRKSIALADIAEEPFVMLPSGSGPFRDVTIAACAAAGFVPRVVQESAEMTSRLVLVGSGVGMTLLPSSSARNSAHGVVYRPIAGRGISLQLLAAWKAGRRSKIAATLVETLRSASRSLD